MARQVRTARGDVVDFDAVLIKQQLAQAPMNIEVARRKEFIDTREGKARGQRKPVVQPAAAAPTEEVVAQPAVQDAPQAIDVRKTKK